MKPTFTTTLAGVCACVILMLSCKPKEASLELTGTLAGITDGKAILSSIGSDDTFSDTVPITAGKFVFKTVLEEPGQFYLMVEDKDYPCYFYAENTEMTLTGHADTLYKAVVTGGKINEDDKKYQKGMEDIYKRFRLDSLYQVFDKSKLEADRNVYDSVSELYTAEADKWEVQFVKENPASFYSAILVERMSYGMSAAEIEQNLALLDPSLAESKIVQDIKDNIEMLKHTDVNLDVFVNNAPDISYELDKNYKGADWKEIIYLAMMPDDNLCALKRDGTVLLINPEGNKVREFKANLQGRASSLAISRETGSIFVMGTLTEMKETKFRGKVYQMEEQKGVECLVYDAQGKEQRSLTLADVKTATGAKIVKNNLLIADVKQRKVSVFDLATGAPGATIRDLRACCGILDFGVNDKEEILVANLGAFRVQAFDYSGKIKYAFGKRGQGLNDFHGCCNPVNVNYLTNGAIITVEKDPTRIKVYSQGGAHKIEGIQELVKGCAYIPMSTDSQNNLYLASANSGLVKCKPVTMRP